ncbi:MAG: carbohydrate-binding family 9-like protein [Bacteroidetes bacterium]|nr:carbohydrate-binding family 9-like protein [Bacteroidota bacterium]
MHTTIPILLAALLFSIGGDDAAEEAYFSIVPNSYCCVKADMPMTIDGRMEEAAWLNAPWTSDFVDIQGEGSPIPRLRTRVKMLWDDAFFYVFAELDEPHVVATLRQRDTVIFQDNDFEIFVCPTGSNLTYYEFETNAFNTVWDLFLAKPYRDGGPADNGWDIMGLKSAVHVRGTLNDPTDIDEGWNVEVAIPWTAFDRTAMYLNGERIPVPPARPVPGQDMRVNFSRVEWHFDAASGSYRKVQGMKEDNWVWSPQGVIDMHRPEKWGWVYFMETPATCDQAKPDPDYVFHLALMRIYNAQKQYFKRHRKYAETLDDLILQPQLLMLNGARLDLRPQKNGYVASYLITRPDDSQTMVTIDENSQLITLEGR